MNHRSFIISVQSSEPELTAEWVRVTSDLSMRPSQLAFLKLVRIL